jgi:hypothetical protein
MENDRYRPTVDLRHILTARKTVAARQSNDQSAREKRQKRNAVCRAKNRFWVVENRFCAFLL